jgi:hypothetical protein
MDVKLGQSHTKEKHELFKRSVLRRILGPKREEVTEGLKKLHNDDLYKE